jgi:ubiquinone/menaquinone biosynthesis C-methylase UbiE
MTYPRQLSDDDLTRDRLTAPRAPEREADLWDLAGLRTGARVADVGCGTGATTVTLAEVVGPDGSVVGIDADPRAVGLAWAALVAADVRNAEVRTGQAEDTGLAEGSFDTVVLRDVFSHNPGLEQHIVDHLARLVRPAGHLYLLDVDEASAHPAAGGCDRRLARLAELGRSAGLVIEAVRGWSEVGEGTPAPHDPVRDRDLARWEAAFGEIDLWTECPRFPLRVSAAVCRRATP